METWTLASMAMLNYQRVYNLMKSRPRRQTQIKKLLSHHRRFPKNQPDIFGVLSCRFCRFLNLSADPQPLHCSLRPKSQCNQVAVAAAREVVCQGIALARCLERTSPKSCPNLWFSQENEVSKYEILGLPMFKQKE